MLQGLVANRLEQLPARAAAGFSVVLPSGQRIGSAEAPVTLRLHSHRPLLHLARGAVGALANDCVEGCMDIEGPMRQVMETAAQMAGNQPLGRAPQADSIWRRWRSRWRHRLGHDARQVQAHYDLSDDFFALWLDPRRVYSCAYFATPALTLAQAQEAKLAHICRKLMLRPGERFLDIGAGWGGLLLWAAEHHGVDATGITLSRNQQAHVNRLIAQRGLQQRVRVRLLDYRELPADEPFDKIASVGMFEHVGRARLPAYFAQIRRLLKPGGLLLNHGITAGGTHNAELGAGIGDFVERHIFPGGELIHIAHVLQVMAEEGLEGLDTENLRPHYARTLWAWSDALEAQLPAAQRLVGEAALRAYRLYLAGSAVGFERGWMALHQTLASRPSGTTGGTGAAGTAEGMRGAQSVYPFQRDYMYPSAAAASRP